MANTAGFYEFTFNDSFAAGTLSTTALNSGGSGYDGGGTHTLYRHHSDRCNEWRDMYLHRHGDEWRLRQHGNYRRSRKLHCWREDYDPQLIARRLRLWRKLDCGYAIKRRASNIRIDVGAGSAVTDPQFWITVGAGTNGAGAIAGVAATSKMTQVACGQGIAPISIVTAYTSYYCYNSTFGTCLAAMKFGGTVANTYAMMFYIHRSNNSNGAPTGTSVSMYANSNSTSAVTTAYQAGVQQTLLYARLLRWHDLGNLGNLSARRNALVRRHAPDAPAGRAVPASPARPGIGCCAGTACWPGTICWPGITC